jgi:hypothetical protein
MMTDKDHTRGGVMGTNDGTKSRTRLPLLLAVCVALIAVMLAAPSPAGADVETGVMYTCPEGSEVTPSEVFPFCSVLSEEVVPTIVLTSYTCPKGAEPSGGAGPSLKCKPTGALGNPGGLYILVDPIDILYTCPDGSSGTPSELFPFCMGKKETPIGSIPTIVRASVTTVTSCPTGSVMSGTECRKPVADVAHEETTTSSCPAGAVEEKMGTIVTCYRTTVTLVPAIETVVPLCNGVVPTIMGTEGDDELVGTENADVIIGLAGNDRIWGLEGNDVICAGDGADWVQAGDGQDYVDGGVGRDRIRGGRQADTIHPGDNGDKIWGNAGADVLHGDGGNDRIIGNVGDDVVVGGRGRVNVLDGRSGLDICSDAQADTIRLECE